MNQTPLTSYAAALEDLRRLARGLKASPAGVARLLEAAWRAVHLNPSPEPVINLWVGRILFATCLLCSETPCDRCSLRWLQDFSTCCR